MLLNEIMEQRKITKYRLSKQSGVPYTTVNDICSGKAQLEKCSAETVFRICRELNIPMEMLLSSCLEKRSSFELFKSNVCHALKEMGDIDFLITELEQDNIQKYWNKRWYPEALYLLATVDYLSRENNIPLCTRYDSLRQRKLDTPIYPAGIISFEAITGNEAAKQNARNNAIPEFARFNIIESEIRNVV